VVVIFLISVVCAFFVYPNKLVPWFEKIRPWRLGLDLVGGSHLIYKIDLSQIDNNDKAATASGLRDVIERRVNLFGVREPQVTISQSAGEYYLNVDLAGVNDVSQAINEIGLTPYLEFAEEITVGTSTQYTPTGLNGRFLKAARLDFDQTTGQPQVAIEFTDEGATLFEQITERNVGKTVAILIDGSVLSNPTVNEKISGGKAVINSANFTTKTAKALAQNLNAGALPAPIELVNQQTVGASLGKTSLNMSIIAGIIGTLLVMLFMIIYYRSFGFMASVALIIYAILSLTVFKLFVTMTLAGIAGFLLSVGMAVDANVLIFERTKEELRRGLSRTVAIKEGFKRAWPSIRDSNISTIITSLILYYFTTSFVKGLALTLLLGVIISMFTAITVTRNLMVAFVRDKAEENNK